MNESTDYTIGAEVSCRDGVCGQLSRVVVDPVARVLTHLVVDPEHRLDIGRLVPVELVDDSAEGIRLRCSRSQFDALEAAEETHFLLDASGETGYADGEVFAWPYYGIGPTMGGAEAVGAPPAVTYDRLPVGEVDVRRGDRVHARDGHIGRIQGLIIHGGDHHVTHVLLQEGHLWGKKEVAIPIGAVTGVTGDGVSLSLSKDEVRDLPEVDLAGDR